MYTVSKGPSKIVAKTRRGLGGGLERLERREAGAGGSRRGEPGRPGPSAPDLDSMPKPIFHSNGRKTVHQRIHQDVITPQHEEMIRFINETWMQTTNSESEPSSPTGTIGSGSSSPAPPTGLYYQDEEPSPALRDFKPFDLETWWGKRLFQNITSSL